jgi:hypothetical protein
MTLAATTLAGHFYVRRLAMGGIGRTIRITGEGDTAALQQAIWGRVQSSWRMWSVPGDSGADVREYLMECDDPAEWKGEPDTLSWSFRDFAGCCTTSMHAVMHWLELALASDWRSLRDLVAQHGFEVVSEAPALSCGGGLVVLRGHLWHVDEDRLVRDGAHLPLADLDEQERARAREARAGCQCSACAFVRPDPSIASAFTRELEGEPAPEVLGSIAWYLARMKDPGPELIAAMGRAVVRHPAHSRPLLDAMETLGPRIPRPDELVLRLAWREGRGEFDRDEALAALQAPAPTSGLAVEYLGRHLHTERETLWPLFVALLDDPTADEETRHRVVLALVNLYVPRGPVPLEVLALFVREGAREPHSQGPGAASLARWAAGVFGNKT